MSRNVGLETIIKARGRQRSMPSSNFLGCPRGNAQKGRKRYMREMCANCLWNWENVHTGEGRVCYNNVSKNYHKAAGGKACSKFELRIGEGKLR